MITIGNNTDYKEFSIVFDISYSEIKANKEHFECLVEAKLIGIRMALMEHEEAFIKDAKRR